jgi:hypothetical protein
MSRDRCELSPELGYRLPDPTQPNPTQPNQPDLSGQTARPPGALRGDSTTPRLDPLPGYRARRAIKGLSAEELAAVAARERAGQARTAVLGRIERLIDGGGARPS